MIIIIFQLGCEDSLYQQQCCGADLSSFIFVLILRAFYVYTIYSLQNCFPYGIEASQRQRYSVLWRALELQFVKSRYGTLHIQPIKLRGEHVIIKSSSTTATRLDRLSKSGNRLRAVAAKTSICNWLHETWHGYPWSCAGTGTIINRPKRIINSLKY